MTYVADLTQQNFYFPPEMVQALKEFSAKHFGEKPKPEMSILGAAACLLLLNLDEETQKEAITAAARFRHDPEGAVKMILATHRPPFDAVEDVVIDVIHNSAGCFSDEFDDFETAIASGLAILAHDVGNSVQGVYRGAELGEKPPAKRVERPTALERSARQVFPADGLKNEVQKSKDRQEKRGRPRKGGGRKKSAGT